MAGSVTVEDATGLAEMVRRREVSATELLEAALDAVERLNPLLNAVVLPQEEVARRSIEAGLPRGPFESVPFLIKDLGCEAVDFPGHNGSRLLANTRYGRDSAIFQRMRATGVVTFGRTTSPEGGIGCATEAAVYGGPTRNPWNPDRTSGGSSGIGAAVAAGIVAMAHGSDGGGSVRIPASCCGLFGFKATRARLPDGPYVGEGWAGMAIDGFLTRSVRDTARMLDACAGADPGAPYVAPPLARSHADAISRPPRRLRIALFEGSFTGTPIDPQVRQAVLEAARLLQDLGHEVQPTARLGADVAMMMRAWTDIVGIGTALSARKALNGRAPTSDKLEGVARGALAHAQGLHPTRYLEAVNEIHAFGRQMAAVFDPEDGSAGPDILLSATLAELPAVVGRFAHTTEDYLAYRTGPGGVFDHSPFCAVFNASGQPAASVPLAMSAQGLPIGIHLAARFGADEELISLCAELEQAAPWRARRPRIRA